MEFIEIRHKNKIFKIKREVVIFVLYRISDVDYSKKDDETIIKAMEKYKLLDEITLNSML